MGIYINPPDQSKEDLLTKHAHTISREEFLAFDDFLGPDTIICFIDNSDFTAAHVSYCPEERDRVSDPDGMEGRPHIFFKIPKAALKGSIPEGLWS